MSIFTVHAVPLSDISFVHRYLRLGCWHSRRGMEVSCAMEHRRQARSTHEKPKHRRVWATVSPKSFVERGHIELES